MPANIGVMCAFKDLLTRSSVYLESLHHGAILPRGQEWPSIEERIELRAALRTLLPQNGWNLVKLEDGPGAFGPPICPWCHRPPRGGRFSIIRSKLLSEMVSVCPICSLALAGKASATQRREFKSRMRPLFDEPDEYFSDDRYWFVDIAGSVRFRRAWDFIDIERTADGKWSWDGFFLGAPQSHSQLHFDSLDGCLQHIVMAFQAEWDTRPTSHGVLASRAILKECILPSRLRPSSARGSSSR